MIQKKTFVFVVLTYNHAKYIIEHLESIKYLINQYGQDYQFKLVVGDDGSRDNTLNLIKFWVDRNKDLFYDVVLQGDGVNRGTCVNYTDLWKHIGSEQFKLTAGDDVYSSENLFAEAKDLANYDFISGMPLILQDGKILKSNKTIIHLLATDIIYKNRKFIDRLKRASIINTPSLLYSSKFITDSDLYNFIREFKVVEDFPFFARIATHYENVKFKQSTKVLVYYRRTSGSTYLIRGSDFEKDKVKVFKYLLSTKKNYLDGLIMKNTLWCFLSNNKLKKLLNLNYYIYGISFSLRALEIFNVFRSLRIDVSKHMTHYEYLKSEADKTLNAFNNKL